MWFWLRKFPVQQGAHAEVQGITSGPLGMSRRATLVVTYPGGRARVATLPNRSRVNGGIKFAARFNAACQAAARVG